MNLTIKAALAAISASIALPAAAQDMPKGPISVSGSAGLVTDYRFRGVSQSDNKAAIQGGLTASHESGLYASFWASNLAGWGQFGGANMELDLVGGYKLKLGGGTLDVGLTWYMYPGGSDKTDFAEPYAKLSGTIGPLSLLGGVAYAPKQEALGRWYYTGADSVAGIPNAPGDKKDNLYLWGDASAGVPGTRATVKAHVGYSHGNRGLGPNGTSVTPTGSYWDWMAGVDYALIGPVTIGVAYVDTDITKRGSAYLQPNFSQVSNGKSIAGARAVFSIGASF
ncbi:TorF family putative porin [Sphingomonas nostoxanthinifaciens]|uniref:TorF family putative porin n=1 Tax=Sphingomonas nostoxanthinifaciens TaxID=2872652 RepID=UPI001CC20217|nr:TorF family putative porin [Sphingomonas nostoxanthinifaciens]UAK25092.1 TorF family putative porin [Sphingomonas nostoxanthinifaciens]